MFLYTSAPFFLMNLISSVLATRKLIEGRKNSKYKPRYDLTFLIVWSYFPTSLVSFVADLYGTSFVENKMNCALFSMVKSLNIVSYVLVPILGVYLFILILTNVRLKTANRVGKVLVFSAVLLNFIRIIFIGGFADYNKTRKFSPGVYLECTYKNNLINKTNLYLKYVSQTLSIIFIVSIIAYEIFVKSSNTETGFDGSRSLGGNRMVKSFILMELIVICMDFFGKFTDSFDSYNFWFYRALFDFVRLKPFFNSLVVLFCDRLVQFRIDDYPLKKFVQIPELNKILDAFLKEPGNENLKKKIKAWSEDFNLLNQTGKSNIGHDNFIDDLKKRSAILEKEIMSEGFYEIFLREDFKDFIIKLSKAGMIELELDEKRN